MKSLAISVFLYTAGSVAASVAITGATLAALGAAEWGDALAISILCPALIAPPITYLDARRRVRLQGLVRELEAAHAALNEAFAQLAEQASRDGLTGVRNRSAFFAAAEGAAEAAGVVLLIDIDHFKAINDAHGHVVGDVALKAVAMAIANAVGREGTVARVGGEEFAVHLPATAEVTAAALAERIRRRVLRLKVIGGAETRVPLSVSIGGATAGAGRSFMDAYHEADRQLYRAKNEGRNRVRGLAGPAIAA